MAMRPLIAAPLLLLALAAPTRASSLECTVKKGVPHPEVFRAQARALLSKDWRGFFSHLSPDKEIVNCGVTRDVESGVEYRPNTVQMGRAVLERTMKACLRGMTVTAVRADVDGSNADYWVVGHRADGTGKVVLFDVWYKFHHFWDPNPGTTFDTAQVSVYTARIGGAGASPILGDWVAVSSQSELDHVMRPITALSLLPSGRLSVEVRSGNARRRYAGTYGVMDDSRLRLSYGGRSEVFTYKQNRRPDAMVGGTIIQMEITDASGLTDSLERFDYLP